MIRVRTASASPRAPRSVHNASTCVSHEPVSRMRASTFSNPLRHVFTRRDDRLFHRAFSQHRHTRAMRSRATTRSDISRFVSLCGACCHRNNWSVVSSFSKRTLGGTSYSWFFCWWLWFSTLRVCGSVVLVYMNFKISQKHSGSLTTAGIQSS